MRHAALCRHFVHTAAAIGLTLIAGTPALAQQQSTNAKLIQQRNDAEKQLQDIAIVERKVMVPMRDGKRMAADIYRPKNAKGKVPVIFVRTPYNFNFWNVRLGAPNDMSDELAAVKRGYAYVEMNERGHFFSEGNYEILGAPVSDGVDAIRWLASQPWSNGKIGTTGCSSTAEWQLAVVSEDDPAFTTFNVQGFGAGVGQVGPYWEQGNWYRGGAVQLLFLSWLYDQQNQVRPVFPPNTPQSELIRASKMFDLEPLTPYVDWEKAFRHLPLKDILKSVDGPSGMFADPMPIPTGGNMVARMPNDPAWRKGGLWHEGMKVNRPGLWFMSWYDVSVSPNLAAYNWVRRTAPKDIAEQQYAVISPSLHCGYTRDTEETKIGDLSVGDPRLDYDNLVYGWFDHFLKGENNGLLKKQPKVLYYVMGENKWRKSSTWPPKGAETRTYHFSSGGKANTLYGDGKLTSQPDTEDRPDTIVYDPSNPVPTFGGGGCCQGNAVKFGAFDQRAHETRNDILVYDTKPFKEGVEVSGPISVTLYVSSSAKDTDFTFQIIDVHPDGKAYNITENIQRMRYRDGYDKPLAWMQPDNIYKVTFQPIDTSNYFKPGHKLRVAISSSNFPRFDRNLNTGGNNYDETESVIAHNTVHHDAQNPSQISITVVPGGGELANVSVGEKEG